MLAVVWGAAARGETPLSSRAKRERPVAVVGKADEPLPEIHVAPDAITLLWFPADIQRKTLTVDESRIRVLDTGTRSIIVQAVPDYRLEERHELGVFFADGQAPARAAFALVMDPAEVDTRIDVQRPELPTGPCPAEMQRAAPRPEDFVLKGFVNARGIPTVVVPKVADSERGFSSEPGVSYRGNGWAIVEVWIRNLSGRSPWTPRDVVLKDKAGENLHARLVTDAKGPVAPGDRVRVLAVLDRAAPSVGPVVVLEVLGDDNRSFVIPRVTLPMEGKP
ncbi:DUF2381 family protein [Hyalangium minutum]|uniref:DUF2381 family protein n=1 Tax=Hyalangium minutum TaxID=394096 RepID=UPI00308405E0